jgi:toxin ParE1/3/4
MRLEIAPRVMVDLEEIADFIARDKPGAAKAWVRKLAAEFAVIHRNPLIFPFAPEIGPGFRKALVGRYVLLFRTQGDVIRIERVLHGMRDLPRSAS